MWKVACRCNARGARAPPLHDGDARWVDASIQTEAHADLLTLARRSPVSDAFDFEMNAPTREACASIRGQVALAAIVAGTDSRATETAQTVAHVDTLAC